jgi:hypothetical protein
VKILVVVDMQADFNAAQSEDLRRAIRLAADPVLKFYDHIVAVNMDNAGSSTIDLPPGTKTLWKCQDDGGEMVYSYLLGAGLISGDMSVVVCGVNLTACVFRTAIGLADRLHREHALSEHVSIDRALCGDGSRFRVGII